ncbi:MAG: histidinol-phosphatase HisJ family protein [Clostridia bacterium]|nr:histidinol-phosphatase HisJ family protein [Clostridia bacterium]
MTAFISDNHVHSTFSEDGKQDMETIVKKAIEKKMKYITFTEHVDYNPADDGYLYFQYEKYSLAVEAMQKKYCDSITILKGIEFGEPHLYHTFFMKETKRNYDLIMGSLHWHGDRFYGGKQMAARFNADDIMKIYYEDTMNMLEYGGFDVLAHLDFPKRYYKFENTVSKRMDEILKTIIKKDIILEVNTSGFRKGYMNLIPDQNVLMRYHELGGRKISLGSDAHHGDELMADFHLTENLECFEQTLFINRKRIVI